MRLTYLPTTLSKMNNTNSTLLSSTRIRSIDILRGIVIVLMILDHVRDYFHIGAFGLNPTDPLTSTIALFSTRWITHLCAPIFIWLAGVSAFAYYKKNGSKKTFSFLFIRGFILILLEFTIIRLGWEFQFDISHISFLVISAIGVCMIALAILQFFQQQIVFIIGIAIIITHNLLDSYDFGNAGWGALLWHILHQSGNIAVTHHLVVFVLFPVLPMIGLICLGFGMGSMFTDDSTEERQALFKRLSVILLLLFISLRLLNEYGDPSQWVRNEAVYRVVFSFLNVTKYPMSLDYILLTMSIAFYLIRFIERNTNSYMERLSVFGKASMFVYIIHIYVIHMLALVMATIKMKSFTAVWESGTWMKLGYEYGHSLFIVYVIWIFILIALYPLCKRYPELKSKYPLLRYI
jgi:uncharacterized membrane protein